MRGKELDKAEFGTDVGITPAYAGKSIRSKRPAPYT